MKLNKLISYSLFLLCVALPGLADEMLTAAPATPAPTTTPSPCSLPASATIPEYNAKISALRTGADQNLIAYAAMTPTARATADGQGMIQQARDMFSEAQACQKMADDMALQIPVMP